MNAQDKRDPLQTVAVSREKLTEVARLLENSMFAYISTGEKAQELASDLYRLLNPTPAPSSGGATLLPIETAPKDGSWFLAYRGPADLGTRDRYVIVRWHDEFNDFIWPDEAFDIVTGDIDEKREDGRFCLSPYESCGSFTHWSPLPTEQASPLPTKMLWERDAENAAAGAMAVQEMLEGLPAQKDPPVSISNGQEGIPMPSEAESAGGGSSARPSPQTIAEARPALSPEEYRRVHDIAVAAYEAATPSDYRYSALALRKAVDAALAATTEGSADV